MPVDRGLQVRSDVPTIKEWVWYYEDDSSPAVVVELELRPSSVKNQKTISQTKKFIGYLKMKNAVRLLFVLCMFCLKCTTAVIYDDDDDVAVLVTSIPRRTTTTTSRPTNANRNSNARIHPFLYNKQNYKTWLGLKTGIWLTLCPPSIFVSKASMSSPSWNFFFFAVSSRDLLTQGESFH